MGGECLDVNECNANPCPPPISKCFNTDGSFTCGCSPGYKPRPEIITSINPATGALGESVLTDEDENCVNVNECDTGDYECSEKERCSDTEGTDRIPEVYFWEKIKKSCQKDHMNAYAQLGTK